MRGGNVITNAVTHRRQFSSRWVQDVFMTDDEVALVSVPDRTRQDEFEEIGTQCDALISGEHIDKSVALGIVKLFHAAQTALLEQRYLHNQELEKLRHELSIVQVTHGRHTTVEQLAADIAQLKQQHAQQAMQSLKTVDDLKSCRTAVETLSARKK